MTKPHYSIDAPDQRRLKIARAEIEAVLRKHDIAGVVTLHTPGMAEFFYDIRPSYSCAWIDEAAGALRVKSKLADYGGDATVQQHDQAATANMTRSLADALDQAAGMFSSIAQIVDSATRAEHGRARYVRDPADGKPE